MKFFEKKKNNNNKKLLHKKHMYILVLTHVKLKKNELKMKENGNEKE